MLAAGWKTVRIAACFEDHSRFAKFDPFVMLYQSRLLRESTEATDIPMIWKTVPVPNSLLLTQWSLDKSVLT